MTRRHLTLHAQKFILWPPDHGLTITQGLPDVLVSYTNCLRDLLVFEALEVAMLVHTVHNCATLWFYPALCHKVQLCVHVYSLHFGVIVIISREAGVQ